MARILRTLTTLLTTRWKSFARLGFGACVGVWLVPILDEMLRTYGHLPETSAALVLGIGAVLAGIGTVKPTRSTAGLLIAPPLLAVFAWVAPRTIVASEHVLTWLPVNVIAVDGVRLGLQFLVVIASLGPLLTLASWWFASFPDGEGKGRARAIDTLGLSLGATASALCFGPWIGTWTPAVGGMIGAALIGTIAWYFAARPQQTETVPSKAEEARGTEHESPMWRVAYVFLLGLLAAVATRFTFELVIPSFAFLHLCWISLLLGTCITFPRWAGRWATEVGLLVACLSILAGFTFHDRVVDGLLSVNASVENLLAIVAFRVAVVGIPFGILGVAWSTTKSSSNDSVAWLPSPVTFAVAFVVGSAAGIALGESVLLAATCGAAVVLLVGRRAWEGRIPVRWQRFVAYVPLALLCAAPWLVTGYHPQRSAKLLFSSRAAQSLRAGDDAAMLMQADAARPVDVFRGPYGTHTVWSHFGLQHEVRTSGVPTGLTSRLARVCPQSPVPTMCTALPLLLHDAPRDVLVLGASDGVAISTALDFPIQSVVCAEADRTRLGMLRSVVWNGLNKSPFDDDRVRFVELPPRLALLCSDERYDVVVHDAATSALGRVASTFDRRFYERCRSRLAEGGLFCQRFRTIDYGPEVVTDVLREFQSGFPDAVVMACVPGELLLVGAEEPGTIRPAVLASRAKSSHVKHVLAMANWDWTTTLTLATLDATALDALEERVDPNSHGDLAYRLPLETLRWDRKYGKQAEALALVATRPIDGVRGEDPIRIEANSRISDRGRAAAVLRDYPDEWWIYRKQLKQQLQSSTRSVRTVSGTSGSVHPVDRARLDYLVALGEAHSERPPSVASIRQVERFASLGDPFLEWFAKAEAARLRASCPTSPPSEELELRLWLLLHENGDGRSVHNVIDTIELVARTPDVIPDPATRWDVLNGLAQHLVDRWERRSASSPLPAKVAIEDSERTLEAQRIACEQLRSLSDAGVVEPEDLEHRLDYVHTHLVEPLRSYRERLRTHAALEERRLSVKHDRAAETESPEVSE